LGRIYEFLRETIQRIDFVTHRLVVNYLTKHHQQVRKRPLGVWKELQFILSVQDKCHEGEPDYENLYAFNRSSRMKLGPELPTLGMNKDKRYYICMCKYRHMYLFTYF
jgi:hypothetical protein